MLPFGTRFAIQFRRASREFREPGPLNVVGLNIGMTAVPSNLLRRPGLEPGSAGLKGRCSIAIELATQKFGWKGRTRTDIRHINSVFTYRLVHFPSGPDDWIRTSNLVLPKHAPSPDWATSGKRITVNHGYQVLFRMRDDSIHPAPLELHSALA